MNDNLRRYCAILKALRQVLKYKAGTHQDNHLTTLAALISGLVASGKAQLPAIAAKSKLGGKSQSRQKRYSRWVKNKSIDPQILFAPFAEALLQSLPASEPLTLVMDGSEVGRGCLALMIAVVYQGRALPLMWTVIKGKKGHFPENTHVALVKKVQSLIPNGRTVIFLGDGEFDGTGLLGYLENLGWKYACRTAKNALVYAEVSDWMPIREHVEHFGLKPGQGVTLHEMLFTAKEYGPVQIGAVWDEGHEEPIFLVTNFPNLEEAHRYYKKRFRIETFFSDQKSRGFHICHSHMSDPARLNRLLIASSLAYYWIVCLGHQVMRNGWTTIVHRNDRCDLGLFRLGMEWLEHCLNEGKKIPVRFSNPHSKRAAIYVR